MLYNSGHALGETWVKREQKYLIVLCWVHLKFCLTIGFGLKTNRTENKKLARNKIRQLLVNNSLLYQYLWLLGGHHLYMNFCVSICLSVCLCACREEHVCHPPYTVNLNYTLYMVLIWIIHYMSPPPHTPAFQCISLQENNGFSLRTL